MISMKRIISIAMVILCVFTCVPAATFTDIDLSAFIFKAEAAENLPRVTIPIPSKTLRLP